METQRRGPAKQKNVRHSISGLHLFHQYYVKLNKFSTTYHVHYWSFMRRIHWWPMDSPHQGSTKRNTLMCNSRSTFVSSILCNIKLNFHHSGVICVSWASSSLATLLVFHQPVHKTRRKTIRLGTTDSLCGETNRKQWYLHTKCQQRQKLSLCNSSISGLHMVERHILQNSGNICMSWDSI